MTMAASSSAGAKALQSGSGADVLRRLREPSIAAMLFVLGGALTLLFFEWFARQHQFSMKHSQDWGHAYLVPFISLYLVHRRRAELAALKAETFWPGVVPMLTGIAALFYFTVRPMTPGPHLFGGLGLILCVAGLALLLVGPAMFNVLAAPIGYLVFAVTLPEMVMNEITFKLQLVASQGAWAVLNIFGVSTELAGNTLLVTAGDGREIPLNVAEACSGMRMVVAFVALGAAVALISCKQWWQRVALILLATPVALGANVLRVVSLAVMSLWDPNFAAGDAHMLIGVLWLVPAFAFYMGVVWTLKNLVRDGAPGSGA